MAANVTGLDHVYYWTSDMARAIEFYRDALGLHLKQQHGDNWAEFDVGGQLFAVHGAVEGHPVSPGGATAVFTVQDLDEAMRALKDRGVEFDPHIGDVPGYGRYAVCRDPDGNTLQLFEYASREA